MSFFRDLNISFRTKLTISYILLIIIPLIIVGVGYYERSSDIIIEGARENILSVLKKSNETLNTTFAIIEQRSRDMHIDDDLYNFFNNADLSDQYYCFSNDRYITNIIHKYFSSSQDIYSVNLITSEYTFGENPTFWLPKNDFSNTSLYHAGHKAKKELIWFPTYDLVNEFNIREEENIELQKHSQYVFSAIREMNFSVVRNNILVPMNPVKERPVLIINFKEEMFQKAFNESTNIEGAYYYVLTETGKVVSSSDGAEYFKFNNINWLDNVVNQKSGTNIAMVKGKKMLICYDTIEPIGWISIVFVPYESLVKTLPTMYYYTIIITLIVMLSSVILASFISGKVTGPMKKLLSAIKNMREGNFNIGPNEVKTGEFKYLFSKFYEMNDRIQRLIRENYQVKIKEKEAEIKALYFQFNPHFLYNTLNIINWMAIENNQEKISDMLINLSEMLEYTAKDDKTIVMLEKEIEYLKSYSYLLMNRFVDRFTIEYDIENELYDYAVPKFFLQPFVENAILHGFEKIEEGGFIKISGWIEKDVTYFCIEDNGKGMDEETINSILRDKDDFMEESKSIGIEVINKRIKLLYGEHYGISIISEINKGTKITIKLPNEDREVGI